MQSLGQYRIYSQKPRMHPYVSLAISILLYFFFVIHSPLIIYEDAFISFRYAENFAKGLGFSFNSDAIPTEGYSNFLWVLILSVSKFANINILILSRYLGIFFSVITIITLNAVSFKTLKRLKWLPSLLLAINPIFLHNCSIGLETSMFGFWVIFLVFLLQKASIYSTKNLPLNLDIGIGTVLIFISLTRPEGFLFGISTILFYCIKNKKLSFKFIFSKWFYIYIFVYLLYLTWKYFYFGQILPNTYYCRIPFGFEGIQERFISGLTYAFYFFIKNPIFLLNIIFILIYIKSIIKDNFQLLLTIFIAIYLFFIIYSGGDDPGFFFFRFFYCLIPLFCILICLYVEKFFERYKKKIFYAAVAIILVFSQIYRDDYFYRIGKETFPSVLLKSGLMSMKELSHFTNQFRYFFWQFKYNKNNSIEFRTGLWLKEHYSPKTLVAGEQAGQIPYYSGFDFIDIWGLVTTEISKTRLRHDEVLRYLRDNSPDLIVTSDPCRLTGMPAFLNNEGFGLRWIIQDSNQTGTDEWRGDRMFVFEKGFQELGTSNVKVKIKGQAFTINRENIINTDLFAF